MNSAALSAENTLLKARLAEIEAALADAVEAQRRLESIIGELRRERFGPASEKLDPEQFNLPLEDVEIAQGILEAAQDKARRALKGRSPNEERPARRNRGHLPKHLPRIERLIEPASTLSKRLRMGTHATYTVHRAAFRQQVVLHRQRHFSLNAQWCGEQ